MHETTGLCRVGLCVDKRMQPYGNGSGFEVYEKDAEWEANGELVLPQLWAALQWLAK